MPEVEDREDIKRRLELEAHNLHFPIALSRFCLYISLDSPVASSGGLYRKLSTTTTAVSPQASGVACRCEQGRNKGKDITTCDSYGKRCPSFRKMKGCGINCSCSKCENPYRAVSASSSSTSSIPRRRQRSQIQNIVETGTHLNQHSTIICLGMRWLVRLRSIVDSGWDQDIPQFCCLGEKLRKF